MVEEFSRALPGVVIYVYDNRSTDNTASEARAGGAIVRAEPWPGKGNVVRRMFAEIEADIYIMADGDGTYDPKAALSMARLLTDGHLDMVVGVRRDIHTDAHRAGHGLGNRLFNGLYARLFGPLFSDIFSGYRVFSRRFVKSFPAVSSGFEIETEMSVHAWQLRMRIAEIPTDYGARQEGSFSKLRTVRDSIRILFTFLILFKEICPARFFGVLSAMLSAVALLLAIPLVITYLKIGLVPRFPTAILVTGMMLLASVFLVSGLILDSLARSRREQKQMWYIATGDRTNPVPASRADEAAVRRYVRPG